MRQVAPTSHARLGERLRILERWLTLPSVGPVYGEVIAGHHHHVHARQLDQHLVPHVFDGVEGGGGVDADEERVAGAQQVVGWFDITGHLADTELDTEQPQNPQYGEYGDEQDQPGGHWVSLSAVVVLGWVRSIHRVWHRHRWWDVHRLQPTWRLRWWEQPPQPGGHDASPSAGNDQVETGRVRVAGEYPVPFLNEHCGWVPGARRHREHDCIVGADSIGFPATGNIRALRDVPVEHYFVLAVDPELNTRNSVSPSGQ